MAFHFTINKVRCVVFPVATLCLPACHQRGRRAKVITMTIPPCRASSISIKAPKRMSGNMARTGAEF